MHNIEGLRRNGPSEAFFLEMGVRLLQRVRFTKGVFLLLLAAHAAWYGAVILLDALRYLPVNTRSSPERRVMPLSVEIFQQGNGVFARGAHSVPQFCGARRGPVGETSANGLFKLGKCPSREGEFFRDARRFACLLEGSHGASAERRLDFAARKDLIECRGGAISLAKCGQAGLPRPASPTPELQRLLGDGKPHRR